jgi:hypothetical protein
MKNPSLLQQRDEGRGGKCGAKRVAEQANELFKKAEGRKFTGAMGAARVV